MSLYKLEQCNICLKNCHSTASTLQGTDGNNIKWFNKLQFTVPELEWLEEYLICDSCIGRLENAWEFKKLVLNLETERRLCLTRKEVYQDSSLDFRDSSDTTDWFNEEEKEKACNSCFKTFTTETQLQQHALQNHTKDKLDETTVVEGTEPHKTVDLYTCYDCDMGFNTKNNLLLHIENDHGKAKTCCICEKSCSNKISLKNHLKHDHGIESLKVCGDKTEDGLFQCDNCKNSYVSEKNLKMHKTWCLKNVNQVNKTISSSISSYSCGICNIKFQSLKEYDIHNSLKHDLQDKPVVDIQLTVKKRRGRKSVKTYCCEICGKQFEYVKLVVEHCISEHGMEKKSVKPYSCEKCDMRFASSANLDQHRHYHEKNRRHVCSLCGKGFITKSDLTVHEYTHYNRRNYKCSKCDKAFNTNKNLRTHNLVVHTDRSLWKYGCSICEKRFPLKTNYEQHVRRHTGEKQYACHICRKLFISNTEMKRHVNLHSNIKAFKCGICGKEYKERRTYEIHMTKVHGIGNAKITVREKKFVCHICPSQFYDQQKLSKHLCSHSGHKPFPCNACDKKFTDKSYLKHHLMAAHNIEQLVTDLME